MRAIEACRTPALGGHIEVCDACGARVVHYHSCGNRHCPKCQTVAKERWVEARQAELLAIEQYFHVVFTLPHDLNALAQGNPRQIYNLLFQAAAQTLHDFAANPRWLGGELGFTAVLHTWGQNLGQHIHVHCIVTGGALSPDALRWLPAKRGFLFPVRALSRVFRGKYLAGLRRLFERDELNFAGSTSKLALPQSFDSFLSQLRASDWVVYAKRPFAGPERVLDYLGRYTHRIAISNHRLIALRNAEVRFRYRDYRRANRSRTLTLSVDEFIRRFLLHVLPQGFMRIRHFGLNANRCRAEKLSTCRAVLAQPAPEPPAKESAAELMLRRSGIDILQCPQCRIGRLRRLRAVAPASLPDLHATGPPAS